ncbi:hypothetical protein EDD84_23810 [Burkholderia gladioli]|nr:hypothetical protein EDD84_23810 [Burkholderia gladioli]
MPRRMKYQTKTCLAACIQARSAASRPHEVGIGTFLLIGVVSSLIVTITDQDVEIAGVSIP